MSVPKWLNVSHQQVFPHRAFVVSDVTAVIDYERSTKDNKVQATDRESGHPLWQVEVLDGDPAASKRARTLTVKFATLSQPECPPNTSGMPFTAVIFEDLWSCRTSIAPANPAASHGPFGRQA